MHLMQPFEFSKVTFDQIQKWPKEKRREFLHFAFQGGRNFYFDKKNSDESFFMNHSCNPNCWFSTDYKICARIGICAGDELTIDYATLMAPNGFDEPFNCDCGEIQCRKVVTKYDCNIPIIKRRYTGHFLSYIEMYWAENKKISKISSAIANLPILKMLV